MWANSVWGLLGLSASCFLTVVGLTPDSSWQRTLLWLAILFACGSAGVLVWPLHRKSYRDKVAAFIAHPAGVLRLIEPTHVILMGLIVAAFGLVWQWRLNSAAVRLSPEPVASATSGPSSPLAKAIESFLARRGKTPHWNETINGHQYVGLGSQTGAADDEFITVWDETLGSWPTTHDGFTEKQLRIFPAKITKFTTNYDREKFRSAVEDLSAIINGQIGELVTLSNNVVGIHPIVGADRDRGAIGPLERLQRIRTLYDGVFTSLFVSTNGHFGQFFDQYPLYNEELRGLIPNDWQAVWDRYNVALANLTRAVSLLRAAEKIPEDRAQYELATANIEPYQTTFAEATQAVRNWTFLPSKRIDLMIKSM